MQSPPQYTFFFFNDTAPTEIYTLSLHDALPISSQHRRRAGHRRHLRRSAVPGDGVRRREIGRDTSELQSRPHLVCRLLLEKKNDDIDLPSIPIIKLWLLSPQDCPSNKALTLLYG